MTDFEKAFRELDLAVEQGLKEAADPPAFYRTTPAEGRIIGLLPRLRDVHQTGRRTPEQPAHPLSEHRLADDPAIVALARPVEPDTQEPWEVAHRAERASRIEGKRPAPLGPPGFQQAQDAARRETIDEATTRRRRDAHTEALITDARAPATELEAQLSDAALQATPAVREMGELVDQRPRCLGTYGAFHGVPTKCSPVAGCGLRGCPWQRSRAEVDDAIAARAHDPRRPTDALIATTEATRSSPPLLPPHESGGPECNHVVWTFGCLECARWAVKNGVDFARHMAARSKGVGTAPLFPEIEIKRTTNGCKACDALGWEIDNGKAIILRGDEADRYRAVQQASARALEAQNAHAQAGQALRDAVQAMCAAIAPGSKP